MTARAGMGSMIQQLRAMTNVGSADYSIAGVAYWTDDQLQTQLDKTRQVYNDVVLDLVPVIEDGAVKYFDYMVPDEVGEYLEQSGTDSGWAVKTTNGSTLTGYTVNYDARIITFPTNTLGSIFILCARSYLLYRAAANVWNWKADHITDAVDWSSDNHSFKDSQEYDHCIAQATLYKKMSGPVVSNFYRTDEVPFA